MESEPFCVYVPKGYEAGISGRESACEAEI
jgi:hypothetical protein